MSQLSVPLGYGKRASIETETFTRILKGRINDNEEIRKDWCMPYEYVAIADAGSSVSDPVWQCVRCTWLNGCKVRVQFRANIRWTERTINWI